METLLVFMPISFFQLYYEPTLKKSKSQDELLFDENYITLFKIAQYCRMAYLVTFLVNMAESIPFSDEAGSVSSCIEKIVVTPSPGTFLTST